MILEVQNLNKSFGGIVAARDINLKVADNQVHAVIGPNGAGKTTLVSQLSGLIKPDSGRILLRGKDITHASIHRRARAGLVRSFQITSIILPLTLLENCALAVQSCANSSGGGQHCYQFWTPATADKSLYAQAMDALEQVGLADKASYQASVVSHGEQRQLEIAMVLALNPKLLLLDEPMAGMSRTETANMIKLLAKVRENRSILLIEHDMDAVFALSDCVSVLVNGAIIASGTCRQIRQNSEVQRAYLGAS